MTEDGYLTGGWHATYPKTGKYLLPPGTGRVGQDGSALIRLARIRNSPIIEVNDEE